MDELVKDLTLDMLPEGIYRDIAEAIGIKNFYTLTEVVGGATIYLPKPESVIRPVRDARIREEFNGYNHPDLARKYRVTERWGSSVVRESWRARWIFLIFWIPDRHRQAESTDKPFLELLHMESSTIL